MFPPLGMTQPGLGGQQFNHKLGRVVPSLMHGQSDSQLDLTRPLGHGRTSLTDGVNLSFKTQSSPFHYYYHHYSTTIVTIIVTIILPPPSSSSSSTPPQSQLSLPPIYLYHVIISY